MLQKIKIVVIKITKICVMYCKIPLVAVAGGGIPAIALIICIVNGHSEEGWDFFERYITISGLMMSFFVFCQTEFIRKSFYKKKVTFNTELGNNAALLISLDNKCNPKQIVDYIHACINDDLIEDERRTAYQNIINDSFNLDKKLNGN